MSTKVIVPKNYGWLEHKLSDEEFDHVKKCIDIPSDDRISLAGNILESIPLYDKDNWFFNNTIVPLIQTYTQEFGNLGNNVPLNQHHPYYMSDWWVNYQKQHEFNPLHFHTGIFSFVIWVKIPIEWEDQNKDNPSNMPSKSSFKFVYTDNLGEIRYYDYNLGAKAEGVMLFFPSKLNHIVYPFYNCEELRVSVSGNIGVDTTIKL